VSTCLRSGGGDCSFQLYEPRLALDRERFVPLGENRTWLDDLGH
jgi:hypothetical protein